MAALQDDDWLGISGWDDVVIPRQQEGRTTDNGQINLVSITCLLVVCIVGIYDLSGHLAVYKRKSRGTEHATVTRMSISTNER